MKELIDTKTEEATEKKGENSNGYNTSQVSSISDKSSSVVKVNDRDLLVMDSGILLGQLLSKLSEQHRKDSSCGVAISKDYLSGVKAFTELAEVLGGLTKDQRNNVSDFSGVAFGGSSGSVKERDVMGAK